MEKDYISIVLRSKNKFFTSKGGLPGVYITGTVPEAEFDLHIKLVLQVKTSRQRSPSGGVP
jgi:hypothetical protein